MSTNGILDFQNTNKIIFRGSDSNVVIDTSNVSLGIGIQGTETPGSNLHVVGDAYISSNLKLTTDTSILVNSNVVTNFSGPHARLPKEVPLKKYPEIIFESGKFDRNDTTNTYTQAGYTVTSSSTFSNGAYPVWEAFNGIFPAGNDGGTEGWISSESPATYDTSATSGEYLPTSQDTFSGAPSGQQNGSWIKIQLPKKIKLDHAVLKQRTGSSCQEYSKNVVIYASTNDSTWQSLGSFDASVSETVTFHTNSTAYYDYFVLHVKSVNHQYAYTAVEELEYYGHEEGSGSLDTTLKTVYNVPATTGTQLEVYYDAKGESTVQSPIPDLSPNTNTGALSTSPPTLDTTDGIESFKF